MDATVGSVSRTDYWENVVAADHAVPSDRPLGDLTVELVEMLGSPDPHLRTDLAYEVLAAWVHQGVYDELLTGLGDGTCLGLLTGLGEDGTDTVFRRTCSARLLTTALARDNDRHLLHPETVLRWGDRALSWFVRERDLRGYVQGHGWAHAVASGADLIGVLAMSRHLEMGGMVVLLDAITDRLLTPTRHYLRDHEDDHLAYATMALLHRNVLGLDFLTPWVEHLATAWQDLPPGEVPPVAANTMAFLRALHLQVLLGVRATTPGHAEGHFGRPLEVRLEMLALLQRTLRTAGPWYRRSSA